MKIGIPKEVHSGEQRVALTPETAGRIQKLGFEISVESGAGEAAQFSDAAYREAGVEVVDETRALWANSDIIMKFDSQRLIPDWGSMRRSFYLKKHADKLLFGLRKTQPA